MAALAIVLYTILHPSVRARRREDIEAALAAMDARDAEASKPKRRNANADANGSATGTAATGTNGASAANGTTNIAEGDLDRPRPGPRNPAIGSDAGLPTAGLDH